MKTTLHIKNMVCDRCIMVVQEQMKRWALPVADISLGTVSTDKEISPPLLEQIRSELKDLGFELISDRQAQLVERVKAAIIDLIYRRSLELRSNLSDWLQQGIGQDYHYLSALFSERESTTIEKYFIAQKIERVKELLQYDELTLTEIAHQLHYSSVAYLSNQFKKVTGLTPSAYREQLGNVRQPLDKVKSYKL